MFFIVLLLALVGVISSSLTHSIKSTITETNSAGTFVQEHSPKPEISQAKEKMMITEDLDWIPFTLPRKR